MPKIKLKSGEEITCEEEWARSVQEQWGDVNIKSNQVIEVSPGRHEMKKVIVSIDLENGQDDTGYDLRNKDHLSKVKKFEEELKLIASLDPEKKLKAFDFWCLEKGYYVGGKVETKEYKGTFGGMPYKYKVIAGYRVRKDIQAAWDLKNALDLLNQKRAWAKKQEHLSQLSGIGLDKCEPKEDLCEICYPYADFKVPTHGLAKIIPKTQFAEQI